MDRPLLLALVRRFVEAITTGRGFQNFCVEAQNGFVGGNNCFIPVS
jgi:hypothetical protein